MTQENHVEDEGSDGTPEPFDPKQIKIHRKNLSFDAIVKRMQKGTIILAPPYQRKEVWDIVKKSQLIESLLLRIPLPSFYVAENDAGAYEVVDGQQRLTAIRDFIFPDGNIANEPNGRGFALESLEYLTDLTKKDTKTQYADLGDYYTQNIDEAELSFVIIDNNTDEGVKFTIFSRINRGGIELTAQEVRHALYNGPSTQLLAELAELPEFKDTYARYFPKKDMSDREVILRALAFIIRPYTAFTPTTRMTDFLSDSMIIINAMPDFSAHRYLRKFGKEYKTSLLVKDMTTLKEHFICGFERSLHLFGEHAFRKSSDTSGRKNPFNKALFEVWIALLSMLDKQEFEILINNKKSFLNKYTAKFKDDTFNRAITKDALVQRSVHNRYSILRGILNDVITTTY